MRTAQIRLLLDRDFDSFGEDKRATLLEDVANLLGATVDELKNVTFRKGCVILEFDVQEDIAEWFIRLSKKAETSENIDEELQAIKDLVRKYHITSVNAERKAPFSIVRRYPTPHQEIALIHGWNGNSTESFGVLPEILKKQFNCEVYVYEYPTGTRDNPPGLHFIAKNLRNALLNNTSGRFLAVIAHSMGGVILRRMLANQLLMPDDVGNRVRIAIFAASPTNGAGLSDLGSHVPFIPKEQLRDLSPDSGFITELNDHWRLWVSKHVPNLCTIKAIYGTDDNVIARANAADYDGEAVPLFANHTNIIKPKNEDSEIVKTLVRFLKEGGLALPQALGSSARTNRVGDAR